MADAGNGNDLKSETGSTNKKFGGHGTAGVTKNRQTNHASNASSSARHEPLGQGKRKLHDTGFEEATEDDSQF